MNMVYLDNCATTPLSPAAKQAIIDNLDEFGNPSSVYELGRRARVLIEDAREKIAKCINAELDEIYFTSGGSESNTWALNQYNSVASLFEHHSINADVYLPVHNNGIIIPKLYSGVDHWTIDLISCMYVNNELGTIQPIKELAEIVHDKKMWFHTDAVQALPHIPINVKDINCDMLSASGHKFGAPKGIGFLYVKRDGPDLDSLIYGGKQEQGLRGGTENVLGIIAMATALEDTVLHMDETNEKIAYLSTLLEENVLNIPGVYDNVLATKNSRIPGVFNLRIDGCNGSDIVALASEYGICISSGSACHSGDPKPSHVLKAIGLTDEQALSSVRISLGRFNGEQDVKYFCEKFPKIIKQLRFIGG